MSQTGSTNKLIIEKYLRPVSMDHGSQLLRKVKQNEHFPSICDIFNKIQQNSSAELDYIIMKLYDRHIQQKTEDGPQKYKTINKQERLNEALHVLQQTQFQLDCLIEELDNKNAFVQQKTKQFQNRQKVIDEDCDMLQHQNNKILSEIQQIDQRENEKQGNKANQKKNQRQLNHLLKKFRCENNNGVFPRNKVEAMKLSAALDVLIQKLEIQKISL